MPAPSFMLFMLNSPVVPTMASMRMRSSMIARSTHSRISSIRLLFQGSCQSGLFSDLCLWRSHQTFPQGKGWNSSQRNELSDVVVDRSSFDRRIGCGAHEMPLAKRNKFYNMQFGKTTQKGCYSLTIVCCERDT